MKKTVTLSTLLFSAIAFQAQVNSTLWKPINEKEIHVTGKRDIVPNIYKTYHLDINQLKNTLASAPLDKNTSAENSNIIVSLPMPNGEVQKFKVAESPVMEESLQMSFPNIRTYNIRGVDDIYAVGKLDLTEFGFHGMVRSPEGDFFIDPFCKWNVEDYISYYTSDFEKPEQFRVPCLGAIDNDNDPSTQKTSETAAMICSGANLRTYRLAVACTGEYAVAATGLATPTTAQILAKVVTSVNRVDGVYETEVAVKLVLVSTTTLVLYGDASTDPFTGNNNASTLIGESQTVIDANVTSANYDIGHTFSTGGGGLANLGCVCSASNKARGITGSGNPVGDPYDIDYVAHEVGHQFKGNHTFRAGSGSCSGNANNATAVEPGSGITIMAYAGICGSTNDLAGNSIPYFHTISFDEIMAFTNTGTGNNCPVTTTTGNNPPVVTGSANYVVPASTPFSLTGSATDPNGDALTYQWEEADAGTSSSNWNSGFKPFFRSYTPITSPTRMFPKLSSVLAGATTYTTVKGEFLPTTTQTLKFRLTARDNKTGGGGVCYALTTVSINATVGPFAVTSQSATGISYPSGSTQTITWNVNGTNGTPVNCTNVNIYVSKDAGVTFTLALANTPNDGTENIAMPSVSVTATTCRVKVESVGNIFFDMNDKNFTITALTTGLNQYANAEGLHLLLYPNPFSNTVKIDITSTNNLNTDKTVLNVYDVLGNIVRTEKIKLTENYTEVFDFSSLANGTYIVEVTDGEKKSVARLVKM